MSVKQIQTIQVSKMNNGAHFAFLSNVVEYAEKQGAVNGFCQKQLAVLRTAVQNEDSVLVRVQKSPFTKLIAEADQQRDDLYSVVLGTARVWRKYPDSQISAAADTLYEHIKAYRLSPDDQYDKQTGLLINLVQDLQGPLAELTRRIHMENVVQKLKEANNSVQNLLNQRNTEEETRETGRVKAARRASDEAYKSFIQAVNAYAYMSQGKEFDLFIDFMNTEIIRLKQQVLRQKAREPQATPGDPVANLPEDEFDGDED